MLFWLSRVGGAGCRRSVVEEMKWWWWHGTGGCDVVGEGIDQRFPLRTAVNTEDVGMRQRTLSESEKRQRSQLPVASSQY